MSKFGDVSRSRLLTCDERLHRIANAAIQIVDFSILVGHRSDKEQQDLYEKGLSQKKAGQSKHNVYPSKAFDFGPYPYDATNIPQYTYIAGIIMAIGAQLGIKLRYGGDWNMNGDLRDNKFNDMGHIELVD